MYFIIENNGEPLRWESDNSIVRYGSFEDATIDFHPQNGDFIVPIAESRDEALKWIDKRHGIEYDANDVVYCLDGSIAEWDDIVNVWFIYQDGDGVHSSEFIRMEG